MAATMPAIENAKVEQFQPRPFSDSRSPITRLALLHAEAEETARLANLLGRSIHVAVVLALAWVLRHPAVITIPKATQPEHVRANLKALDVKLDAEDLAALDAAFPSPKRATRLDMT